MSRVRDKKALSSWVCSATVSEQRRFVSGRESTASYSAVALTHGYPVAPPRGRNCHINLAVYLPRGKAPHKKRDDVRLRADGKADYNRAELDQPAGVILISVVIVL